MALCGGSSFSGEYSLGGRGRKGRAQDGGLGLQRTQGGLAMVAEEFDQFGDQLGLVGATGAEVAPTHWGGTS
jgi:hypothetical protein